jgi:hypothetical protein
VKLSGWGAPARWEEYRAFLVTAVAEGYEVVAVERWIASGRPRDRKLVVLRHDVDQHPRSALKMARIEQDLGVSSTWYFRWRTADPRAIAELRGLGFGIGLHYETLTRRVLSAGADPADPAVIADCRRELAEEIRAFGDRHGGIKSVCPHGDTRVPGVENALLLRDEDPSGYGIEFDANEAMRGAELGLWLTDRALRAGGWRDGLDAHAVLASGVNPILGVVHPNNWVAERSLRIDHALGFLPGPVGTGPVRTRSDQPPSTTTA